MIKKIISTIILSLKGYSLLRIYQIHACKVIKLKAKSIEFGAYKDKNKNFSNYFKGNSKFLFSNIYKDNDKNYLKIDLNKKLKIKKNTIDNIIILNVIEHLPNFTLTFKEISRVLKSGGNIVGSTPFIYQVHGAPNDYYRFTTIRNPFKRLVSWYFMLAPDKNFKTIGGYEKYKSKLKWDKQFLIVSPP